MQRQPLTNFMLVTRESALMTQTIYVRRCDPGWAGRPGSLGVAGRGSLISPGVAGRGSATPRDPANPDMCCWLYLNHFLANPSSVEVEVSLAHGSTHAIRVRASMCAASRLDWIKPCIPPRRARMQSLSGVSSRHEL